MHIPARTRRRLAAVIIVPLLAGAACSDGDSSDSAEVETLSTEADTGTETTSTDTDASTDVATESTDETDDDSLSGGASTLAMPQVADPDEGRPTEPIVVRAGANPFSRLRIVDFRRIGETVTLEFEILIGKVADKAPGGTVTVYDIFNSPEDRYEGGDAKVSDPSRGSVSGVTLVDLANRKQHLVLRNSRGDCICTNFDDQFAGAGTYPHTAQFPAPPADVTRMTVQVPEFPAIDNVPLREVDG